MDVLRHVETVRQTYLDLLRKRSANRVRPVNSWPAKSPSNWPSPIPASPPCSASTSCRARRILPPWSWSPTVRARRARLSERCRVARSKSRSIPSSGMPAASGFACPSRTGRRWNNGSRAGSSIRSPPPKQPATPEDAPLAGAVHHMTEPIAEGGGYLVEVDFGTVPLARSPTCSMRWPRWAQPTCAWASPMAADIDPVIAAELAQ